jgi:uncharacterized protein YigA (DUF484 family)
MYFYQAPERSWGAIKEKGSAPAHRRVRTAINCLAVQIHLAGAHEQSDVFRKVQGSGRKTENRAQVRNEIWGVSWREWELRQQPTSILM